MRHTPDLSEATLERIVQVLTLLSFALSCWTLNRALRPRETCVTSPFIRLVIIEGQRVNNCAFESRLQVGAPRLSRDAVRRLRRLEDTAPFERWFAREPRVLIEVDEAHPRAFDLYAGSVRLGAAWIDEGQQLPRALAMTFLRANRRYAELSPFTTETLADFVTLASHAAANPAGAEQFVTAAPSLAAYCASPVRSLAHERACQGPAAANDHAASVWGFRPILAGALVRTFDGLPLTDKLRVIARVRDGVALPIVEAPSATSVGALAQWLAGTTRAHAGALQMLNGRSADQSLRTALAALDVAAPTHWELTFDLRHTPKWREITGQLRARSKYRRAERALIFTPEGEVALPSGLAAHWSARDVESKKHVMIACPLPTARAAVGVRAERFFARQTCGTLRGSFWD